MTSILKADTIQDTDGNNIINESGNTITIGASGDTTNIIGTLQNNGAAVGGANTPMFSTSITSAQTFNNNTYTKVAFATEQYDTASAFDTSDYRFTVPSGQAGKYNFSGFVIMSPVGTVISNGALNLRINGTSKIQPFWYSGGASTNAWSSIKYLPISLNASYDLSAGDYVELFVYLAKDSGTSDTHTLFHGVSNSHFSGYKLIE